MSKFFWFLLVAWAVAFFGAFIAFWLTPAKDFGLSGGWNKVGVFFGWQAVASALAVVIAVGGRREPRGARFRWLGWVPLAAFLLLAAAFTALILWANFHRPSPDASGPRGPVTAPAPAISSDAVPVSPPADQ